MADYDAIVIGSGHNALATALYLARVGWRVLVVEQAREIGGAVRSAEVTLPGFTHDLFATNVGMFAASPVHRDFKPDFDRAGLKFLTNPYPYASAYSGGRALRVYADRERTEREIAAHSSEDLAGWRAIVGLFARTAPHVLPLFFTALPSGAALRQAARILSAGPGDALALWRILRATPRAFADRLFRTPESKGLLVPWAYHMDYGPDVAGGAVFAFVAGLSGHMRGLYVAEGGAGRIVQAMRTVLEISGGVVRTGAAATRIVVEQGRAIGVELAGGETVRARRAVIAGVSPHSLFGGLVREEHWPARFLRRASRYRYGPATFVVHLALDRKLEWRAAADLAEFNYVHLCATTDEIERTHADSLAGLLPARPLLVVSQTTPVDPSRAPPGRHIARIHVRTVPFAIKGDAAGTIAARDWPGAAEAYADRLLDLLAEHAPNVRQALLARHVVTPVEIARDNANLVAGDCVSGSHHLDQNYWRRPLRGWSRYAMPIRGLYMVGAATWPGGGVHGGSGYLLAQRLLARAA